MKLVAAKDFFNAKGISVPPETLKADGRFRHENHVHKCVRFSIGTATVYKELTDEQKFAVGTLISREMAVMDSDENKDRIAKIDAESKDDFAAYKKALAPKANFITQLVEAMSVAFAKALADAKAAK
jgi:hypothetical protein